MTQTIKGKIVVQLDLAAILNYVTKSVTKLYCYIKFVFNALIDIFHNQMC